MIFIFCIFFHSFFFFFNVIKMLYFVTALAEGTIPSELGFPAHSFCSQSSLSIHNLKQSDVFDSLIIKAGSAFNLQINSSGGGES